LVATGELCEKIKNTQSFPGGNKDVSFADMTRKAFLYLSFCSGCIENRKHKCPPEAEQAMIVALQIST
jgi:hypothetical protein